jgi:serine/threonine-protein kinase
MPPTLTPGTIIGSRYRILGWIGRGGMAEVYRAEHLVLKRQVALKLLPAERAGGDLGVRFEREAQTAARLDHPGCIRVFDSGRHPDGSHFLVMDLIEGPTLRARMGEIGRVPAVRAIRVVGDLLRALSHAHRLGILHRDVKPENIMFAPSERGERVVLIDFGLARVFEDPSLTAVGTCVGSPSYVAPERLLQQPYDERADIYSAGVILYELLAGIRPIRGDTPDEIARRQVERMPPPLIVAPLLGEVAMRALAKDPRERYATAHAMASDLEWAARRERVSTMPPVFDLPPESSGAISTAT